MGAIEDSGALGIATRLQRLSEIIRKDGFLIYKANGVDFEPKWFSIKAKLVTSRKHNTDERKRLLHLSKKGQLLIEQMQPVWDIIISAVRELIDTENNLMKAIIEVEDRLREKSFFERARQ